MGKRTAKTGAVGGVTALVIFAAQQMGVDMPPEAAGGLISAAGYLFRNFFD